MNPSITQQSGNPRNAISQLSDTIETSLLKACALAAHTYGEDSGTGFRDMSEEYQDVYLWTVAELIRDAKQAWDTMNELMIDIRKTPEAA